MKTLRVGLVGDYSRDVTAHRAIPRALVIAADACGSAVEETWLPTAELADQHAIDLDAFDGLWCVPASPYRSFDGAIRAIRHAREKKVPFLGTCGGFQHAVIEYARHVLGQTDAGHLEIDPGTNAPFFAPLACSMVEVDASVSLLAGSRLAGIYGRSPVVERYRCNFGMNPSVVKQFDGSTMVVSGVDEAGHPRAVEIIGQFFVGTAYQPERSALDGQPHPLITAFVAALHV